MRNYEHCFFCFLWHWRCDIRDSCCSGGHYGCSVFVAQQDRVFNSGKFRVPDNIVASGTVTFSVAVMAATVPGAPKQIVHTFGWVALEDHEDFDVAYTDEDSGPGTITADEDYIEIHEWTETVATLGWNGGDLILFRYSKVDVPGGDHLVGDTYLFHLTVKIPV